MPGNGNAAPLNPNPATVSQRLVCQSPENVAVIPTGILGWSAAESTGSAAAKFRLRDGTAVSAPLLTATVALASGASSQAWFAEQAVEVNSGAIFVEVVAGSVELVVYWA